MKLPRDLSGQEVIKALKRLGFSVVRTHGSHVRLTKSDKRVTVPAHAALRPGTLSSILKQASITIEDLMANL